MSDACPECHKLVSVVDDTIALHSNPAGEPCGTGLKKRRSVIAAKRIRGAEDEAASLRAKVSTLEARIAELEGERDAALVDLTLARESESRRFGEWMDAVEELGASRDEAARLLRPLEWSGRDSYTGRQMCNECRALECLGRKHADGCALAAYLAIHPAQPEATSATPTKNGETK